MSLIHWWPLNGDLKDYGTNNTSLTNNGDATINNSGKIGKCYLLDGTDDYLQGPSFTVPTTGAFSIAGWYYHNSNKTWGRLYEFTSQNVTGITAAKTVTGLACGSDGKTLTMFNGKGGTTTTNKTWTTLSTGTWYHWVVIYNGTNIKLYLNGTSLGETTYTSYAGDTFTYTFFGKSSWIGDQYLNGKINDLRIYDHALSIKEVKELSKGLCLHYTFEDPYIEGTTNLVPNSSTFNSWSSYDGGYTSIVDSELGGKKVVITNVRSWCGIHVVLTLPSTGTYTISAWCKPISRTSSSVRQTVYTSGGGIGDKDASAVWTNLGSWQRVSMTQTYTSTSVHLYLIAYGGTTSEKISCEYTMPQIEAKDHATPYVDGTRSAGIVYDSSGYGYNGTVIGDPQVIDSGGGSGNKCVRLLDATNGYFDLGTSTFNFITNGTVCFWARYSSSNHKMIFGANDGGARYFAAYNSTDNVWYSNLNGESQGTIYCDGVLRNNPIFDDAWHFYAFSGVNFSKWGNLKYFLCIYANNPSNVYQFHGYLADLKIYATALSASDILAEYNRKASIDKAGNLFAEYFKEDLLTIPKIHKNGVVSASAFSDGTLIKVFDDGAIFERIYYFDYDIAGSAWDTATAKNCNTTGKFSILGKLNNYVPSDGWYEFYYREKDRWVRWKQSYNPLSRYTSGSSGTASEYSYIGGSTTPYSGFYGLTRYASDDSNSCYLRGAPSWWCAIAPYGTSYDVFPNMWGNSSNNHHQELWIRIDNLKSGYEFKDTKIKMTKRAITANEIKEI